MNSKTFTAAPKPKQPTAEAVEAFEKGGEGTDHLPSARGTASTTPQEPSKRLSLDLPASTHRRFKTACSATGRKMVAEVAEFIERRTAELEEEAGFRRN